MTNVIQRRLTPLDAKPENVVWGYFDANIAPILQIQSGETVQINTVSLSGIKPGEHPVDFFGRNGIPAADVLEDMTAVQFAKAPTPGLGPHVITGPIYVQDAEPGDMLEVRVLDIMLRTPFGVNHTKPGLGVLPDLLPEAIAKVIPFNVTKTKAIFSDDIEIPLAPFLGIMGVAPPADLGRVSSIPPGAWGGNIDLKQMQKGSTLYLPVFNPGALFFAGDGHAAQGNGEVNLTAIETSLTATLQIILHKNRGHDMPGPRAETLTHHILMGLNPDLDEALKRCVQETVLFLHHQKNLSLADAYSLCSIAIDFEIAEAVDQVQLVYSLVSKSLFKQSSPYWFSDTRSGDL